MDINIHASFLPHDDADAAIAFYRDALGFEVRKDVGYEGMRWITVGPAGQPDTSIVLHPPTADPGITEDEQRTIAEMMAKGTFATVVLSTPDLDGTFERIVATGAEVIQEPVDQPYGVRDCAFRDPAGTTCGSTRRSRAPRCARDGHRVRQPRALPSRLEVLGDLVDQGVGDHAPPARACAEIESTRSNGARRSTLPSTCACRTLPP